MKEITKQWLDFAKADLKSCLNNLEDDFLTNIVAFHTQQSVEKCFKAIIVENNKTLPRIHSLIRLYAIVKEVINFSIDLDMLSTLDEVYTSSRYPSDLGLMPDGKPSIAIATKLYNFANQIFNYTFQMLEK